MWKNFYQIIKLNLSVLKLVAKGGNLEVLTVWKYKNFDFPYRVEGSSREVVETIRVALVKD